jgi:DNA-directed RNA polymerase subunit RPC12/RpoP
MSPIFKQSKECDECRRPSAARVEIFSASNTEFVCSDCFAEILTIPSEQKERLKLRHYCPVCGGRRLVYYFVPNEDGEPPTYTLVCHSCEEVVVEDEDKQISSLILAYTQKDR